MTTPKFQPSPTMLEPLLWVHIALLLGTPWFLGLCLTGLAVGEPLLPSSLEILLLAVPAIALPAWLQWQRPFSPFSIWVVAQPIPELSARQLQILALLRPLPLGIPISESTRWSELIPPLKQKKFGQAWELTQQAIKSTQLVWHPGGWLAIVVGVFLYSILRFLYQIAPLASEYAPFPPALRLFGLVWAGVFLLLASLAMQMGVACLRILLIDPAQFAQTQAFSADQVRSSFTSWGMRIAKLLNFEQDFEGNSRSWNLDFDFAFVPQELFQNLVNWWKRRPIQTKVTREEPPETPAAASEPEPEPETPAAASEPEPEPETPAATSEPEPEPETPAAASEPEPETPAAANEPEPTDQNTASSTDSQDPDAWV
ncbi:MAG: hypothetical protein SFT94_11205 [Pseudanabaenaceae cyanobacterium bins.68]|nr:hypothetical protein [Pseudanabaenaceae cyanobacterium bins.68]